MSYEIVKKILGAYRGADFVKTDLHIHTPASIDWDDKNPEPENHSSKITPDHIIQAALAAGLELIAITDHNSVEWCEKVAIASRNTRLVVLPGFELTVRPGVHVLALFSRHKSVDELRDILVKVGIKRKDFGNPEVMTEGSVVDMSSRFKVVQELIEAGAVVIPAHVELESGLIGRLKGGKAIKDFISKSGCNMLEVVKDELHPTLTQILKENPRQFAVVRGSDAHRLDQIGKNSMWLKMDEPSLQGLKQIAFESALRVCYGKPEYQLKSKPQIVGIFSNGGLLADQVFAFNEDLNCIIGGRGAGKSAVVDHLRFVFSDEPIDDYLSKLFRKRLADLIRNHNTVYVLVSDGAGDLWLYERTLEFEEKRERGNRYDYDIKSYPATVYSVLNKEESLVKLVEDKPIFQVEFYGQGEVQSLTDTAALDRQLRLVDNYIWHSLLPRDTAAKDAESRLDHLEKRVLEIEEELDILQGKISESPVFKDRVAEIERDLQENNLEAHQVWVDANAWVANAYKHLDEQKQIVEEVRIDDLEDREFDIPDVTAKGALENLLAKINSLLQLMKDEQEQIKEKVYTLYAEAAVAKETWDDAYGFEKRRHAEVMRRQRVENLTMLYRELTTKKEECRRIEKELIPRRKALRGEYNTLLDSRKRELSELFKKWKEIRNIRKLGAEAMTKKLGSSVIIEISEQRNLNAYFDFLNDVAPQGIREREKQLQKVVEAFMPYQLAKHIHENKEEELRAIPGITSGTVTKLLQIPLVDLMRLERVRCDDIARIYLVQDGKKKSLDGLSVGEKCTAVLAVVLLDQSRPLVIDQPEDELDHAFIVSNVVETLGRVKFRHDPTRPNDSPVLGRQFIISTHNQNIPVLGDAEMVHKMRKIAGEDTCEAEVSRGLEHPSIMQHILSLEGGHEAFDRRRRKYQSSTL